MRQKLWATSQYSKSGLAHLWIIPHYNRPFAICNRQGEYYDNLQFSDKDFTGKCKKCEKLAGK